MTGKVPCRPSGSERPVQVLHLGPLAASSGGIASVVEAQSAWRMSGFRQHRVVTTRGAGPLSDLRHCLRATVRLTRSAFSAPTLVHAHVSQGGSFVREGFLVLFARALGLPVAVHVHGSRFAVFSSRHPRLVRTVLSRAGVVFVLTKEAEALVKELSGPGTDVVLIHNSSPELDAATLSERRRGVVVFGGVVGVRKGADILLDAWSRICPAAVSSGWRLDIFGPLDDDQPVVSVDSLPAGARWLGAVPHEELMEHLTTAAIAVLPSRAEAFPMFLVEAMARAVVPVASDVGDVARLVGREGRVVTPGSSEALAAALLELMDLPPGQLSSLGARARLRLSCHFGERRLQELVERGWERCLAG